MDKLHINKPIYSKIKKYILHILILSLLVGALPLFLFEGNKAYALGAGSGTENDPMDKRLFHEKVLELKQNQLPRASFTIEVWRDGKKVSEVTSPSGYQSHTNSPPFTYAQTGDELRFIDKSTAAVGNIITRDFQTNYGGKEPFPNRITMTQEGTFTYYLNVRQTDGRFSANGNHKVKEGPNNLTPFWWYWYFSKASIVVVDPPEEEDPPPIIDPRGDAAIRVAEQGSSNYTTHFEIPSGQNSIALDLVNLSSSNVNSNGYLFSTGLGTTRTTYRVNERVTSNYTEGSYIATISFSSTSGGLYFDSIKFTVGKGPQIGMPELDVRATPREVHKGETVYLDVSTREYGDTYRITGFDSWSISGYDSGHGRLPSSIDTSELSGGTYTATQTAEVENGGLINGSDTFRVIELEPPGIKLYAMIDPVNRGDYQQFIQLNNIGIEGTFPVTNKYWSIMDLSNGEIVDLGSGFIPEDYFVTLEEGNYEAFQYLKYRNLGREETVFDSDTFQVVEHVDFRPIPQIQKAGADINIYNEMTVIGNDESEWFIRKKGESAYQPLILTPGDKGSEGAFTIGKDSISEPVEYEVKLVLNKENGQKKEAVQVVKFLNNPSLDFDLNPKEIFVDDYVQFIDNKKNILWENIEHTIAGITKDDVPALDSTIRPMELDSEFRFTKTIPGFYQVKRATTDYKIKKVSGYIISNGLNTRFPSELSQTIANYVRNSGLEAGSASVEYIENSVLWDSNAYQSNGISVREISFWYLVEDPLDDKDTVRFLNDVPESVFNIQVATGYIDTVNPKMEPYGGENRGKMYKKIKLDGSPSVLATDDKLQEKYPIDFNHDKTRFIIEPLTSRYGNVDTSKLQYILGEGGEVIDNAVVFKGKKEQDIRIDKDGWYRIKYQVYNGRHVSEFDEREYTNIQYIEVKPEVAPEVNIEIPYKTVFRDNNNSLISETILDLEFNSVDDDIDLDSLKVSFAYDSNDDKNFTNDGVHSNQYFYLTSINQAGRKNVQDYIKNITISSISDTKRRVVIQVDNIQKNHLGNFKFEFEATEKLKIPNFDELGVVEVLFTSTEYIPSSQKISEIDNIRPTIEMEGLVQGATTEIWLFEVGGVPFTETQIKDLINSLKTNNVAAVLYLIKPDGAVEQYTTDTSGNLKKI